MQPTQKNEIVVKRQIPLVVGAIYQLIPSMGGQYIVLTKVDKRYAYAVGYDHHFADIKVRIKRFSEIVIKMVGSTYTGGSALLLTGESGYVLMLTGDRIGLLE